LSDVHEMAFAPVLVATAILAIERRRWRLLWIVSALLMLVKEDLIPFAASCGVYLAYLGERRRGALLTIIGLLMFVVTLTIVIPWFNQGAGWSTGGAFQAVWQRPWAAPLLMFSPPQKIWTVVFWLAPFLFLPLLSPLGLLLVPIGVERLLSASANHWGLGGHYSAPLAPILVMSASDGLARLARRIREPGARSRLIAGCAGASVCLSAILPGHQPLWLLFSARHYRDRPTQQVAQQALAAVPAGASLVAQTAIAPHLSHRAQIYLLKNGAPDATYVIAATDLDPWPAQSDEVTQLLAERRQRGYVTVFDESGWVVLRRR